MDLLQTLARLDSLIEKTATNLKETQDFWVDPELRTELLHGGLSLIGRLLSTESREYREFEQCANGVAKDDAKKALGILRAVRDQVEVEGAPNAAGIATAVPTTNHRQVFVVHGRNLDARREVFSFLSAVGLQPLEWTKAITLTRSTAPFVGEVLDAAFREAQAIVVLLTGDDMARLGKAFVTKDDAVYEKELTPQPRPNVLFEAGMAFGRHPDRTILVSLGSTRPFSDIAGRHTLHLANTEESKRAFLSSLKIAGCDVDENMDRSVLLGNGDFEATIWDSDQETGGR